jgi:hypothetical protein
MTGCEHQASGVVELYFYDELEAAARTSVERHVAGCVECRQTLEDLSMIRTALSSRPRIDAPRGGDWTGFMSRLNAAIQTSDRELGASGPREFAQSNVRAFPGAASPNFRSPERPNSRLLRYASYVATAALFTLVTSGLVYVGRHSARVDPPTSPQVATSDVSVARPEEASAGFAALSEQHFERSKLVVLGLANKDAKVVSEQDWAYERGLASNLLDDTRLYRMAAEDRGLTTLAGVMGDLELVLLQTSLAEAPDAATLDRIQRLIQKRDLVTKMDVAVTGS